MSPKAILRRQSRRAMGTLMREHGYKRDQFEITEFNSGHDVLPGTAMYWWRCSYEYDEWDYHPAHEELRMLIADLSVDWERVAREDRLRDKYAMMSDYPERFRINTTGTPEPTEER